LKGDCLNICGNGFLWRLGEHDHDGFQCDDGNEDPGDGCTQCIIDSGYECIRDRGGTSLYEIPLSVYEDICYETLVVAFAEKTDVVSTEPLLQMEFMNQDICFDADFFFLIYEPYTLKFDATGESYAILNFELTIEKPCRIYIFQYLLKDDYKGELGFRRKDKGIMDPKTPEKQLINIIDVYKNIVDFGVSPFTVTISFSNYLVEQKKKLLAQQKKLANIQAIMAGPLFLAMMAIGPLADFSANVLQR
jgi:hypothetical protein